MHQTCDGFYFILKKHLKLSQKNPICWLILRGFWFTPSYAQWLTPQSSAKFNFLWRYILVVSFISLAFVAVKLLMFRCFGGDAASMKPPFWGVPEPSPLSPSSPPNFDSSLLKFWPELISYQTKTISKQSFKIQCLSRNGTYPKLKVLVHFAA